MRRHEMVDEVHLLDLDIDSLDPTDLGLPLDLGDDDDDGDSDDLGFRSLFEHPEAILHDAA